MWSPYCALVDVKNTSKGDEKDGHLKPPDTKATARVAFGGIGELFV